MENKGNVRTINLNHKNQAIHYPELKSAEQMWEELKISDDFLFNKVMQNPKLCKRVLEVILEVKIDHIEYSQTEKSLRLMKDGKGVRLDVYVADENHTVYNVEMQATNTKELPKRSRYYQGIIDMDIISKGQMYATLKKSYVIFICAFDLFGYGLHKYTFENLCKENPEIALEDETQKIFLNATAIMDGLDVDEDLKAFLNYVNGKEKGIRNDFVQDLKNEAEKVKNNVDWRRDYMMQHMRDQLKVEEGKEIGAITNVISLIKKKVQKAKSLETIAGELESEPEEIRSLYDAVVKCGAEATIEEILEALTTASDIPLGSSPQPF